MIACLVLKTKMKAIFSIHIQNFQNNMLRLPSLPIQVKLLPIALTKVYVLNDKCLKYIC